MRNKQIKREIIHLAIPSMLTAFIWLFGWRSWQSLELWTVIANTTYQLILLGMGLTAFLASGSAYFFLKKPQATENPAPPLPNLTREEREKQQNYARLLMQQNAEEAEHPNSKVQNSSVTTETLPPPPAKPPVCPDCNSVYCVNSGGTNPCTNPPPPPKGFSELITEEAMKTIPHLIKKLEFHAELNPETNMWEIKNASLSGTTESEEQPAKEQVKPPENKQPKLTKVQP